LKETVQYNHYCREDSINQYEYRWKENGDGDRYMGSPEIDRKSVDPKDRFVLRSKFTVEYNVKGIPLNPFASIDYGCGLNYTANKWKYSVGADYTINKKHKLTLYYRFQTEDDDDEPNGLMLGMGYKIKF
jgi:outer membrane autotransporter protein